MEKPKTVLVTGGCGYLGSKLIRELAANQSNIVIRIIDNMHSGSYDALKKLPESGHYQFMEGDILNPDVIEIAVRDVDVVIHLAAIAQTPLSFENSSWVQQVNHWGSTHLINAAIANNVSQFIFASSTAVYGPGNSKKENSDRKPLGAYAESKYMAENALFSAMERGLNATIFRIGTIFGNSPVTRYQAFVNKLVLMAALRRKSIIYGKGTQLRPIISVGDAARIISQSLFDKSFFNQVFNLVAENISILSLVDILKEFKQDLVVRKTEQDLRTHYSFEAINEKIKGLNKFEFGSIATNVKGMLDDFYGFERIKGVDRRR